MENQGRRLALVTLATIVLVLAAAGYGFAQLTPTEELGEMLYFDEALSDPDGQSCGSCHDPTVGFDDPDEDVPVSEGVVPGLFGTRNSPISAYAMYVPPFHFDAVEGLYIGGVFWDGRAMGDVLGDPLADQAAGPPLNPVEMANPDKETVLAGILGGTYAQLFIDVCGEPNLTNPTEVDAAYDCMAQAIGAFERTELFGQFSSKYDAYLRRCLAMGGLPGDCAQGVGSVADMARRRVLTNQEWYGLQLFMGENDNDGTMEPGEGAFCSACHTADWIDPAVYDPYGLSVHVPDWGNGMIPPIFTDSSYDNLGVPHSQDPLLIGNPLDLGLGGVLSDTLEYGKFRVVTLRNAGLSAPYLHNGFLDTLEEVVHFYNTRDDGTWPVPEVADNVNHDELGNLGLATEDEAAIAAFMRTLSDGFVYHVFVPLIHK